MRAFGRMVTEHCVIGKYFKKRLKTLIIIKLKAQLKKATD
jgi:hypothetical protein